MLSIPSISACIMYQVLRWTMEFQEALRSQGKETNHETVKEQAWATLNSGQCG
jgi:hypothetical protein